MVCGKLGGYDFGAGGGSITVPIHGHAIIFVIQKCRRPSHPRSIDQKWTDWIDYWSVDFDYHSKHEIITVAAPDITGHIVDGPQWTDGYVFEDEWQYFRTRRDRNLELTSAAQC